MKNQHEAWRSVQEKVKNTLGEGFWTEFSGILPFQQPRMDVFRQGHYVYAYLEIPGVADPSSLSIVLHKNKLTISGTIPPEYAIEEEDRVANERFVGAFRRQVDLPVSIRKDQVQATTRNGLLIVAMAIDRDEEPVVKVPIQPEGKG